MSNKRNVPKLRFKEFINSPDLQEKKLREVGTFKKGKGISKSDIDCDGVNECIRYGELYTTYGNLIDTVRSRTNCSKDKMVLSTGKEIIIPSSGETVEDISTASAVLRKGIILGGDLNIIELDKHSNVYFSYLLKYKQKKNVAKLAQGISVIHLYNEQLKTLKLNVPNINEQNRIGKFLYNLDNRIEKQQELIEKYKELKKGYLQKLFPKKGKNIPELRFNKFIKHEEWNPTIIDKLINESNIKTKENNQHNILSSTKKGLFLQSDYFDKQVASQNNIGYKIVARDQFILSPQNAWMGNYNINDNYDIGIVSPSYKVFNVHNHVVYPLFFKNFIRTTLFNRIIESNSEAGASIVRRNLNIDNLLSEEVYTPSIEEQVLIGEFLEKISVVSAILEELQTNNIKEKQYFLNNLLV